MMGGTPSYYLPLFLEWYSHLVFIIFAEIKRFLTRITTFLIFSFFITPFSAQVASASNDYLKKLIQKSTQQRLYEHPHWQALLYYDTKGLSKDVVSLALGKFFFNHPRGREDPQTELEATLANFFSTALLPASKQTAQCTFVARYRWLSEKLNFDPQKLPKQKCPQFEEYLQLLQPKSVSVVIAANSFNDPASLWGHIFLKVTPQKAEKWYDGQSLAYAAQLPQEKENMVSYMAKGIFGGYPGLLHLIPYKAQVSQYNEVENRDIWEYELNFTKEQIDLLVMHSWELGSTHFQYFFFRENCAFWLLPLLEIANPQFNLTEDIYFSTVPADVMRSIQAQGGIKSIYYRPSRINQVHYAMGKLGFQDQELALRVAENPLEVIPFEEIQDLSPQHQRHVIQAADTYSRFQMVKTVEDKWIEAAGQLETYMEQHQIPRSFSPQMDALPGIETGHPLSYVSLGRGVADEQTISQLKFSPHFHDLLFRDSGYVPGTQMNLLVLNLLYNHTRGEASVATFDIIDMISLAPVKPYRQSYSWKTRVGWQKPYNIECDGCTVFSGRLGLGRTEKTHKWFQEEWLYFFLEPEFQVGSLFDEGYRLGLNLPIGTIFEISDEWKMAMTGIHTLFFQGSDKDLSQVRIEQRFGLSKQGEIRLDWKISDSNPESEIVLSWGYHY